MKRMSLAAARRLFDGLVIAMLVCAVLFTLSNNFFLGCAVILLGLAATAFHFAVLRGPHIPKSKWYWYSKILCGGVLACGIVVFQILEKQFILSAYSSADYCININSTMLLESEILLLLGMCTIYWLYAIVSLFGNEIIGFIVCTAYVVLGLPVKFPVFYCAGFMYRRGTIGMAIAMAGIVLAFTLIAGTKKINRMDIFSE